MASSLKQSGLDFFHMTDFENYPGPYEGWDTRKHESVIKRLIKVITDTAALGVGVGVMMDDFETLRQDPRFPEYDVGTPYGLAAAWCIGMIGRWLEGQGQSESVAYVFELGDEHQDRLRQGVMRLSGSRTWRETFRVHSLRFEEKRKVPAIQAADMLAYETCKQAQKNLGLVNRPIRKSLRALLEGVPHESALFDAAALNRLVGQRFTFQAQVLREIIRTEIGRSRNQS